MRLFAANLLFLLFLLACAPTGQPETPTLRYRTETIEKTYRNCDSTRYECGVASLRYILIEETDPPALADTINQHLRKWLMGDYFPRPEALVDSFLSAYDRVIQQNPWMLEEEAGWRYSLHQAVRHKTPRLLVLEEFYSEFTGGVHENYRSSFININLQTGHFLELDDLFPPEAAAALRSLGEQYFRKSMQLPAQGSLQEQHYEFEADSFYLPENFGLGPQGLTFRYDLYEIGPFTMGEPEFTIPYEALKPFFKPDDPIGTFPVVFR